MRPVARSRPEFALYALPRVLLVAGTIGWFLGSDAAGVIALGMAAYLWLDFWVRALRFKRAREHVSRRGKEAPDPSAPSQFGARLLYRDRQMGPRAILIDRHLSQRPFISMAVYFGAVSLVLCSIGILAGLGAGDVFGFGLVLMFFGTLVGGGVVWLAENKPDTSAALTRAIAQENIKGGPPPF